MIISFDQKHFELCFMKKYFQNYKRLVSKPIYPGPVKFALPGCKTGDLISKFNKHTLKSSIQTQQSRLTQKSVILL